MRGKCETYIARLVLFPCDGWLLFPLPELFVVVVLGGTVVSVALYARRVANIYPGPVELLPLLMVLLIA